MLWLLRLSAQQPMPSPRQSTGPPTAYALPHHEGCTAHSALPLALPYGDWVPVCSQMLKGIEVGDGGAGTRTPDTADMSRML